MNAGVTTGTIHNEVEVTSEEHEYLNNYYNFVNQRYKDSKWYVYDGADIHVNSATNLESVKYVQGDLDEGNWTKYPDTGTVTPGGKIKYKVVVTNKGTVGVKMSRLLMPFLESAIPESLTRRRAEANGVRS